VQMLAMALHELATNAVKYGALGQPQARLTVRWWLMPAADGASPRLCIDWRESQVVMPQDGAPHGTGQGRELIERALPYQLDARTHLSLEPDGLHCTIDLPVSETNGGG
jgi:two-component sensor histidine kinase